MAVKPNIHFLNDADAATDVIAQYILNQSPGSNLESVQLILHDNRYAPALRQSLLAQASAQQIPALLGPRFYSLDHWLVPYLPTDATICSEQTRLLILVDALNHAPHLLKQANPWSLADSLLQLFDELTLNRIEPVADAQQFAAQLANWYQTGKRLFSGLQHEAQLVHHLWYAWHEQMQATGYIDRTAARLIALQRSAADDNQDRTLHLIGIAPDSLATQEWLAAILNHDNVHLWVHGKPLSTEGMSRADDDLYTQARRLNVDLQPDSQVGEYSRLLNCIFSREPAFLPRMQQVRSRIPQSPLNRRLQIYSAQGSEQQVTAIDTQIRRWLLEGKQRIGVLTEDRMLARRLRALLERADIALQDSAGWALSTTRAAATLESLLLCIEEDFASDALLDLFKSGHLFTERTDIELGKLIHRFENDILQHEKLTTNLQRYRHAIFSRLHRLEKLWPFAPQQLADLLEQIEQACQPLQRLYTATVQPGRARKPVRIEHYVEALLQTLHALGIHRSLQQDAAGQVLLTLLEEMQLAAQQQGMSAGWSEFRSWLGRNLERHYFQPQQQPSAVQLLSLSQAGFTQFDALIIAAMEADSLPGNPPLLQFYNNSVRHQLGLSDNETFMAQRLRRFVNLLHSAPQILLTCRYENEAEPIAVSPWLLAIQECHAEAYQDRLIADELIQVLKHQSTQVIRCDTQDLPAIQRQPVTAVPTEHIPDKISASGYQQLMDCPYQYFAARCLQLSPPEEIQQALSKKEYGERIHLCLQAFHANVDSLPGPFTSPVTSANRAQAIELMQMIAQQVFREDIEENFVHLAWYQQWLKVIPNYIDWLIEYRGTAQVIHTELQLERPLNDRLSIRGRLDRIDLNDGRYELIDYKSGTLPSRNEVLSGEKVQLPFYVGLLTPEAFPQDLYTSGYLALGKEDQFKASFPLQDEELSELSQAVMQRLLDINQQLHEGHVLPAWEHDKVCPYCSMASLCRRGSWDTSCE